jgi:pyridoxal phosphate enzyme (YggS family)
MSEIVENITVLKKTLPSSVTLVAVSKTKPSELILDAYNSGQRVFGENKIQELVYKQETLPKDIIWHMIGHVQTNKVKFIAPFVNVIHSVESIKLLRTINNEAAKNDRVINCLLQVKIAQEETKCGLSEAQLEDFLQLEELKSFSNICISGLMGMATYTSDKSKIREEFKNLKRIFDRTKLEYFSNEQSFSEISMGMSSDYTLAIEEGSTMVRVGSSIFGERIYS